MMVRPWSNLGDFPALAPEVEIGWAPILGPSSLVVWRRANALFGSGMGKIDPDLLGQLVGLRGTGRNGTNVTVALRRLAEFGLARFDEGDVQVAVRADLPRSSLRKRWPPMLDVWAETLKQTCG